MLKAVIIDIDNTLIDFHKCAHFAVQKAFLRHGLNFNDGVMETFITINDGLWLQVERGEIDRETLWKIRFKKILSALNVTYSAPELVEKDFRAILFDTAIAVDGAKDLLRYLKGKYKVYAGSNAIYDQQINRLKLCNLLEYFDGVFVSEKLGYQKPTKEFFDACFSQMNGVSKDQVVMIGDSITADIKGGKEYGLKTVWYDYKKSGVKCEFADYTVESLMQIKDIL